MKHTNKSTAVIIVIIISFLFSVLFLFGQSQAPDLESSASAIAIVNSRLTITFTRQEPAKSDYNVEASNDLVTWTRIASFSAGATSWSGPATVIPVVETGSGSVRTVTVTDLATTTSSQRRFIRLVVSPATTASFDPISALDTYNLSWAGLNAGVTQSANRPPSLQSMPLGNGDIGLNVWTEVNGDLVFYIGKTDAWVESPTSQQGLVKLGGVRISVLSQPNFSINPATQTLLLHQAEIDVTEGVKGHQVTLRVWVDANLPVIHVESNSDDPVSLKVALEMWRTSDLPYDSSTQSGGFSADTLLTRPTNQILWYHRDGQSSAVSSDPHVKNWTFGGLIKGPGFISQGSATLTSSHPLQQNELSIYALTATTPTAQDWQNQITQTAANVDSVPLATAWTQHLAWWDSFWNRSWIFLQGDSDATATTQGYLLQRFVTACAGRGAYPIKFNGSIFTVDNPAAKVSKSSNILQPVNADFRTWGGPYTFQNTRALYWPRLMAGDYDIMQPLFKMYLQMLVNNAPSVQAYYGHPGSYCGEASPFWGGLSNLNKISSDQESAHGYTTFYFTDVLELSMMGLDYYDYTGDEQFLQNTLLPMATYGLTFFANHFPKDNSGKLLLDPDNANETFWKVHDPMPDISGLYATLDRLLALPAGKVNTSLLADWKNLRSILPPIPTGIKNGHTDLFPYTSAQISHHKNNENPELYAVYPFRLYGLGLPNYSVASNAFQDRVNNGYICWSPDPVQAAMLGLTSTAQSRVTQNFAHKDPAQKFPAFWAVNADYQPDEDNGGNGEVALQWMLLMPRGQTLYLLPAWPLGWTAQFKLHAPGQTTLQGSVSNGIVSSLTVTPTERQSDVVIVTPTTAASLMQQ